jgi:LPXTG-motif cell wall-anchored protein
MEDFMRKLRLPGILGTASATAVLLVATASPAVATGDQHEVGLHQPTPISADEPEFVHEECPGIPVGQDGWHFVLPGNSTTFVELRVTFEPGGEQVITLFGPPSDKHAYVASEAGAELTAASATVEGEPVDFRLSHTCPAAAGEEPVEETPEEETPEEETPEEETPVDEAPEEEAPEEGVAGGTTPQGGAEAEAEDEEDLAETGSSTPVIAISAGAAALLAAGGYLALRRSRGSSGA